MDQHKLYRTIQVLAETPVRTEDQLVIHVMEGIAKEQRIPIRGTRIWKLEVSTGTYRLIHQSGEMEAIDKNFRIKVQEYPFFQQLQRKGTVIGRETNPYLVQKGIKTFSATGVGEKIQWKQLSLYQYVIGITAAFAALLVIADLLARGRTAPAPVRATAKPNYALVASGFAVFGVYVAALPYVGFRLATALYVAATAAVLARPRDAKGWAKVLVLAVITAAATYFVFERYLSVLLPRGKWTGW